MSIICKKWVELRELPDIEKSEISYIRLHDISRVSIIENEDETHSVFVSTVDDKYLYSVVDTLQEAKLAAKGLIHDVEGLVMSLR